MQANQTDIIVLGAGAAGLFCAMAAGQRGRRVIVLDHAAKPAEKVRISGGGRCNFTNLHTSPEHFLSANPRYCASALARYTPSDFVSLVEKHGIGYHEKTHGQLFCDGLSQQIIAMLLDECREAGVTMLLNVAIENVCHSGECFFVQTTSGKLSSQSLVVATGGLSIPKMGATNLGYRLATQFGLPVIPTEPALVPFTMPEAHLRAWHSLAGVSVPSTVVCGKRTFQEALLFTHRGLSGPAILQASSYWHPGDPVCVDLAPGAHASELLLRTKVDRPKQTPGAALQTILPKRLAQQLVDVQFGPSSVPCLAELPNSQLQHLAKAVHEWHFVPNGTEGYRTAEVTRGGVDTRALSSKTMAAAIVPGLYFIGEVVDVTGHLGGFNFQWAWASGYVAGQYA